MIDSNETLAYESGRDAGYLDGYDNGFNDALYKLTLEMKQQYFHKVGTQFDNAILEMDKIAERLKKK